MIIYNSQAQAELQNYWSVVVNTLNKNNYLHSIYILGKAIKTLSTYNHSYVFVSTLGMLMQGILPSVTLVIMQRIVNLLQRGNFDLNYLLILGGIFLLCNFTEEVLTYVYSYYTNIVSIEFNKSISLSMIQKASKLSLESYENPDTYDIINRAQSQGGTSLIAAITQFQGIIKSGVTIVSMLVLLIRYRWWMAIAIVFIPVVKCVITVKIDNEWFIKKCKRTKKERKAWYIEFLMMTGNAHKEIMLLGIKKYLIDECRKIKDSIIGQDRAMYKKTLFWGLTLEISDIVVSGMMYAYTLIQGFYGYILIGNVLTYLECIRNVCDHLNGIFSQISDAVQQAMYIEWYYRFMDLEEMRCNEGIEINYIDCIEFKNVSYKYNMRDEYAVKNINFKLERDEPIGIIGENGSGKSTLIKLILGYYDNYEGTIYVNGIDMKKINKESYFKRIGCVFQDYIKFEGTVRDNIGYGNMKLYNSDIDLFRIVDEMKLDKVLSREKLDTQVGNWFGKQLSGGEWQRIAISRTIARNADLLLFDEPDASIDITKQLEMVGVYKKYFENKLGVYITHKINSVHHLVSKIYVMDQGKIIQEGCHDELIKIDGKYKELYDKSLRY